MKTITRERAELKSFITGFLTDPAHDNQSINSMTTKVFRIALTALDAEAQEPVAVPDKVRDAINRLLDNDGSRGFFSIIRSTEAREELEQILAAPQPVAGTGKGDVYE